MKPIAEVAAQNHWFRAPGYDMLGIAATGAAVNNLADVGIPSDTLQAHLLSRADHNA